MRVLGFCLLILCVVFINEIGKSEARGRGGGGGGRYGGGGSRGSRGGSYRGGSRGSSRGKWRTSGSSSRYKMRVKINSYRKWSVRANYPSQSRYKSASIYSKRRAILMGQIYMSHKYRGRINIYENHYYNDFSVCINVALVDKNITKSPWFVCPLIEMHKTRCCGADLSEYCCSYFDNAGNVAWVTILVIFLVFTGLIMCYIMRDNVANCASAICSGLCFVVTCRCIKWSKIANRCKRKKKPKQNVDYSADLQTNVELQPASVPEAAPPYPLDDKMPAPNPDPTQDAPAKEGPEPDLPPPSYDGLYTKT